MGKQRLDALLVQEGHAPGRDKAKALIMAGQVYVNGRRAEKAGEEAPENAIIEVRGSSLRWVSRGGLKLEKALAVFPIRLDGAVCMDIGASTGGFTDCMLENGAAKVYAVDVGYGQLAWKLRGDDRVIVWERTNIRHVTPEQVGEPLDFASVDVSFISLGLVFPVMAVLLKEGGEAVCLVKPQFEAGREKVGKNGVVRELATHKEVAARVCKLATERGFSLGGFDYSPVKGPQGNIEYLLYLRKGDAAAIDLDDVAAVVERSHTELNKENNHE
jgi:23S rRNA (cytidine1920-2'-O)/16S rRNA (cytidine1409-2'-O)-methyltransferase